MLEIGAGIGDLTEALLRSARHVTAIERDRELLPILQDRFQGVDGLQLVETNALTYEIDDGQAPWVVVGNLPYHISSRILFHLLAQRSRWCRAVLMFQKEVAQRVAANDPGTAHWSGLSAKVARVCDVTWVCDVSPGCFHPPPRVHSAVVALSPKAEGDELPDAAYNEMVRVVFAERRKTLRNNLKKGVDHPLEFIDATLEALDIDPGIRGERLSVDALRSLTKALILK